MTTFDTDVVVIGAGPVGLTLANLIGVRGHRATVLEARHQLIDYPRGVGLDDESIRTLHTAGLWEQIQPFTVPHHVVRLVNGSGQVLATNNPKTQEFGYPRKHGFVQPLVDKELASDLDQFPGTELRLSHKVVGLEDRGDHVEVTAEQIDTDGEVTGTVTVTARYAVGCEGGSSFTRKWMGVEFEESRPRPAGWSSTWPTTRSAPRRSISAPTHAARTCPSVCRRASAAGSSCSTTTSRPSCATTPRSCTPCSSAMSPTRRH